MADVFACSTPECQGYANFICTSQLNLAFDWFNGVCVLVVNVLGWDKFALWVQWIFLTPYLVFVKTVFQRGKRVIVCMFQ